MDGSWLRQGRIAQVVLGTAALLAGMLGAVAPEIGGASPAAAQSPGVLHLVVDTSTDAVDAAPGDGICDDGTGHCTLRAAFQEVNRLAPVGTSVITLTTNVDLSIPPVGDDGEESGDLNSFGKVAIFGKGHRIHAHLIDRVIHQHRGKLNLSNVTLVGGVTPQNQPFGGGVWAEGTLNLNRATFWANRAMGLHSAGGAIYGSETSTIVVGDSTFLSNVATDWFPDDNRGGAIASHGRLTIAGSTFLQNSAGRSGRGGGVSASGPTTSISRSVFRANVSPGGGVATESPSFTLADSTVADNTGIEGMGLAVFAGTAIVERSTIATDGGTGGGFAVWVWSGAATVSTSTLVGTNMGWLPLIWSDTDSSIRLISNTIDYAGTTGIDPRSAAFFGTVVLRGNLVRATSGPLCSPFSIVTSEGFNVTSDSTCGLAGPSDLIDAEVALGALSDNGGPTPTELPLPGSPAVDAVPVGTPGLCDGTISTDQRGVARPQGSACDVGAVEVAATPAVPPAS